ncbi:MAG: DUF3179 domain-containing protein [Cyclobacteriaceae bacterium]|nr:DUF3179 domain-containing protein [Cyclobacteriaceae bacterium]
MKKILFAIGIVALLLTEILRVYFIMPFPGSQQQNSIALAYAIHQHIFWIRSVGIILIAYPAFYFLFQHKGQVGRWVVAGLLLLYMVIAYLFNFKFLADKMFYQPGSIVFAGSAHNIIPTSNLVLGVYLNGRAKAYPIEIIGYHHQVRDTLGEIPLMITYCTVCRTGRVYSPVVDGNPEEFRLVGMDHFNAMFEDKSTGSWWRQVNGEAIVGKRKGKVLTEIPSEQVSLEAWLEQYPAAVILQPDSTFSEQYKGLSKFDEGKSKGSLTRRDSLSWKEKSWVVGVQLGRMSRAYDWNDLIRARVINDTLANIPIAIVVEHDSASFHVFRRDLYSFSKDAYSETLTDSPTSSVWNFRGYCTDGPLKGSQLTKIQSYQEFWHSWRTFHPRTSQFILQKSD